MKKIGLSIITCIYLNGCNSSAIFEADKLAVKHLEFDKNVTVLLLAKIINYTKKKINILM